MANHRRPDWAATGICVVCGGATPRAVRGLRPPRKTCGDECRRVVRIRSVSTHGQSRSPLHVVWGAMIQRCTNPKSQDWALYGGRGIRVCERWRSFENFIADVGERPKGGMLDRIDNDGHYEPGNVRWASAKEQMRNRRSTRFLEFKGERRSVIEWSEVTGIKEQTIRSRLAKCWPVERILSEVAIVGKNQSGVRP